jgi:hypothetical protein
MKAAGHFFLDVNCIQKAASIDVEKTVSLMCNFIKKQIINCMNIDNTICAPCALTYNYIDTRTDKMSSLLFTQPT